MSARIDKVLTRLWLALASALALATSLHLGALTGAHRWPGLFPASASPVPLGAPSPGAREPAPGSVVVGCHRRTTDANAKFCRVPAEN